MSCMQIHGKVQHYIIVLHQVFIDHIYRKIGLDKEIDDEKPEYTIVIPSTYGSARRKYITQKFQEYCEKIYFPIITTLYFGEHWQSIKQHFMAYKVNTMLQIDLRPNIYHMHLDAKVGIIDKSTKYSKRITRILTSYMHNAVLHPENTHLYGATVYPMEQHTKPFKCMNDYHSYMRSIYPERGKSEGGPRPLYEMHKVKRLLSGQVAVHASHVLPNQSQVIHSEPNPNPEGGRYAIIWDFENVIERDGKKVLNVIDIPMERILNYMTPLTKDDEKLKYRLSLVSKMIDHVVPLMTKYI